MDLQTFKKLCRKKRVRAFFFILFAAFAMTHLVNAALYREPWLIAFAALIGHYINMSLEYQGIRLTYGMSIDYLVMPGIARDTRQRGGTLITLHPDSGYDIEQVPLTAVEAG